jgi:hypothetical protein
MRLAGIRAGITMGFTFRASAILAQAFEPTPSHAVCSMCDRDRVPGSGEVVRSRRWRCAGGSGTTYPLSPPIDGVRAGAARSSADDGVDREGADDHPAASAASSVATGWRGCQSATRS